MKMIAFRILCLLTLLGSASTLTKGQQIVWEKIWGFKPFWSDVLFKVTHNHNSKNYLAIGATNRYGYQIGQSVFKGAVLYKCNLYGDSLSQVNLQFPVQDFIYLGYKVGNVYEAVYNQQVAIGSAFVDFFPCIVQFDTNGTIINQMVLSGYRNFFATTAIKTSDQGLLLTGYFDGGITAPTNMMAIKVNFLNEVEWGRQFTPPVPTAGRGFRIEPKPNGNYLLSGYVGRRIYGYEIDAFGNVVDQKIFYETPSNRVFDEGFASQLWRNQIFSFGDFRSSNPNGAAMFLHDSAGNKIWGGESPGNIGYVAVNREHSIVYRQFDGTFAYLTRLSKDSTVLWSNNLGQGGGSHPIKRISDIYFENNDTGIVVGTFLPGAAGPNTGNEFYMARIAGVGTRYDPSQPWDTVITTQELLWRPKETPLPYPNPFSGSLQFKGLEAKGILSIYNLQAQKLNSQPISPGKAADLSHLPKGAYLYHLRVGEKVFTGKVVKKE